MKYYEIAEKDFRNRGKIIPVTELSHEPRDYEAYSTLFAYGSPVKEWVEINGTVAGYNKEFYLDTFYFDIDKEDLNEALQETKKLIMLLYKRFDLHPDDLLIFFSGGKGFHVGIPQKVFGGFEPSTQLPYQVKTLAKSIVGDKVDIDYKIYKPNIMFRLPHSKHKSGRYKVPVTASELKKGIEEIKEIADFPRPEFSPTRNLNDIVVNEKLQTLWEKSKHTTELVGNPDRRKLKEGNFFKPPTEYRNNTLFKQAAMLCDKGMSMGDVHDIIKSINKASGNPLPDKEVYTLTASAVRKTNAGKNETTKGKPEEKKKKKTSKKLLTVSDMVPEYIDYLSPSNRKLSLLFPEFSVDTRHKLRGKLIGVFGKDGTKKSLFCQNIVYKNMRKYGARAVLSNMEMGANPLMSRIIDRTLRNYRDRPSNDLENDISTGNESKARKKLDAVAKHYSDKLVVTNESAMTPDRYRKLIKYVEQSYGKVDMLVVDGFSMMGGTGSDRFQRQEDNSRELKEIAKDYDVAIFAIFHANASCEKWYRRPDRYVRGSDKQLDNIDIAISLSLIVDESKTKSTTDVYYREDKGYSLMYNKRGSGNTLRKIFDFDSKRLAMIPTDDTPSDYEVKMNQHK